MDKIYIKDLDFIGYHGLFDEEQKLGQKFLISLTLSVDLRSCTENDDIDKTVHYGKVAEEVKNIFYSKNYKLIESLAEDIAKNVLIKFNLINEIEVEIKKPWAPIGINLDYVSVKIKRKWNKVYISLGSNIGDRHKNLNDAINFIKNLDNTSVTKISTFIETKPFGNVNQDDFLNACIEVKTLYFAEELLEQLLNIELQMGRVRTIKWGPRNIDLDIIFFNRDILDKDNLIIPHPYMHERLFVLEPLIELAPNYIHPLLNKTISTIKRELINDNFMEKSK